MKRQNLSFNLENNMKSLSIERNPNQLCGVHKNQVKIKTNRLR